MIKVLGKPCKPSPSQTSSHQQSWKHSEKVMWQCLKTKGFLKEAIVERGNRASSPVMVQRVGKAENWQQAPEPELGIGLRHSF